VYAQPFTPPAQVRQFFRQHAYFIMGGARTGSNLHVDPQYTCAWNTLLSGLKRWVIFPPGESDEYRAELGLPVGANQGVAFAKNPPAVWWRDVHAKLVQSGRAKELGMLEAVQRPGDTIFVPRGWHHAVLNLGWTVAVTQNLILPAMLPEVLQRLRVKFPRFAARWARALRKHRAEAWAQYGDAISAEADAVLPGEVDDDEDRITESELFC
jgi:histone arginine demethylase JMJD6